MREPRQKLPPDAVEGFYHLMSRTVNGEKIFGEVEKEVLRRHIWLVADYCGIQVLDYSVMSNHFHVVVRVPKRETVSDAELLRRYRLLHPCSSIWRRRRMAAVERILAGNGPSAEFWRKRQLAMMGDISPYMQLLKQRYSIWFNRTHERFGTLWAHRYTSTLAESGAAVMALAVYVDLNAVEAGIVKDPKDYRFCGYAEALAGDKKAQDGLVLAVGSPNWQQCQVDYRFHLFGRATAPKRDEVGLGREALLEVVDASGRVSLGELVRMRGRYLTNGAVLGSKAFVMEQLARYKRQTARGQRTEAQEPPELARIGLAIMRNPSRLGFG